MEAHASMEDGTSMKMNAGMKASERDEMTRLALFARANWADSFNSLSTLNSLMFAFVIVVFTAHNRLDLEYGDLTRLNFCIKQSMVLSTPANSECWIPSYYMVDNGVWAAILFMAGILCAICGALISNTFGNYFVVRALQTGNLTLLRYWTGFMLVLVITTLGISIAGIYYFFRMNQATLDVLMPMFPDSSLGVVTSRGQGFVSYQSKLYTLIVQSNYSLFSNPFTMDIAAWQPNGFNDLIHQIKGMQLENSGISISIVVPIVIGVMTVFGLYLGR